jgi:hypothetical protein
MTNKYTEIFERALSGKGTVEDIFVFIYFTKYIDFESWNEIEDLIENKYGKRPDWHKCKEMINNMSGEVVNSNLENK